MNETLKETALDWVNDLITQYENAQTYSEIACMADEAAQFLLWIRDIFE